MPVKINRWTSKRKLRFGSKKKKKKKLLRWLLAALLIALLQALPLNLLRQDAPDPNRGPAGSPEDPSMQDSSYFRFLQIMLGSSVPGLEPPAPAGREQIYGAVLDTFRSLTGMDPRDPRSFLEMGLGLGTRATMPVFIPPSGALPDHPSGRDPGLEPEQPDLGKPGFIPFYPFPFQGYNDPVMLVYHTHITESFVPTSGIRFSENLDCTVARLGEELVKLLRESYGLPLIHDRQVYDLPRAYAYEKARPAVGKILAGNPQLDLVVDLHRDGIPREITTTVLNGRKTGKILLVIGTRHQGWEANFEFALRLQQELEAVAPGLSRGIRQQGFVYNQDLHSRAILVEVGGHENSLEEAMLAVPYLAEALARAYYVLFAAD